MSAQSERNTQQRIQSIEEGLIQLFPNVNSRKNVTNDHIESMIETSRSKKPDGFYIFTVIKKNDSHGILVYKETTPNNEVNYYLYEPNGIGYINHGFKFYIRVDIDEPPTDLDLRMVPRRSINDQGGDCAIWCIIVIILWNSFEGNDRWIALDIFHSKMLSNSSVRKSFIESVTNLIANKRRIDYTVLQQVKTFVEEVRMMLNELPIVLPN